MDKINQIKAEERRKLQERADRKALRLRYGKSGTPSATKITAVARGITARNNIKPRLDDRNNLRNNTKGLNKKGLATSSAVMRTINSFLGGKKRTITRKLNKSRRRVKSRRR